MTGLLKRLLRPKPAALTIAARSKDRQNNLDVIRLIAASAVILSHAFPLTTGSYRHEPLMELTDGQMSLGRLAVAVFFIISGYLIAASYDRTQDIIAFARARVLRIFPGLALVALLTAFGLGPLVSSLTAPEYFGSALPYSYVLRTIVLRSPDHLPGVFQHNVFQGSVNGSLWTLFYEVTCYVVVGLLGVLRLLRKQIVFVVFLAAMLVPLPLPRSFVWHRDMLTAWIDLFRVFAAGMLFYGFRDHIKLRRDVALLAVVGLAVSSHFHMLALFFPLLGAYLVLFLGFAPPIPLQTFLKGVDLSYGVYIYAFPIQQTVTQCFGGTMDPVINILISFPFVILFALMSWFGVEKRFLKLKKRVRQPSQ